MGEIRTEPVTAVLVDNIVADDAPAGAIKFYSTQDHTPAGFHFQCPCGCREIGRVVVAGPGAWEWWNGSREKPSVRESVALATKGVPHWHGYLTDGVWRSC